jgi:hypothetical protein
VEDRGRTQRDKRKFISIELCAGVYAYPCHGNDCLGADLIHEAESFPYCLRGFPGAAKDEGVAQIRRMRIRSSIKGFCYAKDFWRQLDIQGLHEFVVHHDGEILLL